MQWTREPKSGRFIYSHELKLNLGEYSSFFISQDEIALSFVIFVLSLSYFSVLASQGLANQDELQSSHICYINHAIQGALQKTIHSLLTYERQSRSLLFSVFIIAAKHHL